MILGEHEREIISITSKSPIYTLGWPRFTLREYIELYLKKDVYYVKALSALYERLKKIKKFASSNMNEDLFITKSKKVEKLNDEMYQLLHEMGEMEQLRDWN